MRPYDLKDYEVATVLRFFMYHMPMEQRRQLMAEFPVIYNKLCESEIMVSIQKSRFDALKLIVNPPHGPRRPEAMEG